MLSQKRSSKRTLNAYLYSTKNVVDRLVQLQVQEVVQGHVQGHNLRNPNAATNTAVTSTPKEKDKKAAAALAKLEREMTKITDPILLASAREYQQGLKEGTRSFIE